MTYPVKSWDQYEAQLRAAGEYRSSSTADAEFLIELGLLGVDGVLTKLGQAYFEASFINKDAVSVTLVMQSAFRSYVPAEAISQKLFGVRGVDKATVNSTLRNAGLGSGLTDRNLGTLLVILARFEVISYTRGKGEIVVLIPPLDAGQTPGTIFISRDTPFSNVMWLGRVLKQCKEHIYWLDKHFKAAGLEALADVADGNQIQDIRILSLQLPDNSTPKIRKSYQSLKAELAYRGISLEWRYIESTMVRDTHDRWIIGSNSAYNVPDVGTIMSGNKSEMSASDNAMRLNEDFSAYWDEGVEVGSSAMDKTQAVASGV